MPNKYCRELAELRSQPAHELKEVGDQWRTPDNIFWGINAMFGPLVLDLFSDGENSKCEAYYTAEDNALTQDWSARLEELNGAAFGNPPYSRASQHEEQYITGMRYIMQHASAMREKGGRYVFLIKAATSEVWWPEDADHIAFIRGRIGFDLPTWFVPKDEKQVPTGAFFAGAVAVFDKSWRGPAMSYISRKDLEARGDAFLAQIRREAERLAGLLAPQKEPQNIPEIIPETTMQVEEPAQPIDEPEIPLTKNDIIEKSGFNFWACACAAFGDKEEYTFSESRFAHTWATDSVANPEFIVVPTETVDKAMALIKENADQQEVIAWLGQQSFEHDGIRNDMQDRLLILASEVIAEYGLSAADVTATLESIPSHRWHNIRSLRIRFRILMESQKAEASAC
ncbi:phage N-6-adenine-methyltransferase [Atlantibacter subterraneus]|uniref:phage N-6-adenine-methyltransferase n=1 Tax=Atlantibacter subterraneus TaxID=255519 RepID=UPI0022EAEEBD|nr:phage N-6-adenine-methyltransferase [Atlantibacter subterranea]MDA3135387.1 phage N-6-adenine-methyltransferase [Atlantibacter subterranea]